MKLFIKVNGFQVQPSSHSCTLFYTFAKFYRVATIFAKFDPWTWHKKRKGTCFLIFPEGLSCAPLKFSVEKKMLSLLILHRSIDFLEIKHMYVNTY